MGTTLTEALRRECADLLPELPPGGTREAVGRIVERLADPVLRIAIGGRLKSGKSTLLNALLGQRLAPTGRNECTMISASFVYGPANQVSLHLTDGSVRVIAGRPGGGIPDRLPLPRQQVQHLTVRTPNRQLDRGYVLVDTPGRDSLSGLDSDAMESIREADALLMVTPTLGAGDQEALKEYQGAVRGRVLSAANVIGVLSRIDQAGDGGQEPAAQQELAERLARRAHRRLSVLVAEVIPVFGLLAQTTRGQDFTDAHARALLRVDRRSPTLLFSPEDFVREASGVLPRQMCVELLSLLGLHGIRVALAAIEEGATGTDALLGRLDQASGIARLSDAIESRFLARADALRAGAALARLEAIADAPASLRTLLRRWRTLPELRLGALSAAAQAIQSGQLEATEDEARQIEHLLSGATPAARLGLPADAPRATVADAARRYAARWRAKEVYAPRSMESHIVTFRLFYEHLHKHASETR